MRRASVVRDGEYVSPSRIRQVVAIGDDGTEIDIPVTNVKFKETCDGTPTQVTVGLHGHRVVFTQDMRFHD